MSEIIKPKIYNVDRYVLASVLHKPDGKGPFPAVILLPGFLSGKDNEQIKTLAYSLAGNGIVALRFDPTGFGDSEGTIAEDYRLSIYMNDIDTMWNYLKHQPFVKSDVIGLWGKSVGGILALSYAADYPSTIKAVAIGSSSKTFDSGKFINMKLSSWEKDGKAEIETAQYGTFSVPYAFIKDGHPYNALDAVKLVKQPILVVAGTMDDRVEERETREIFTAANDPKEFVEILGMGHDYSEKKEIEEKVNNAVTDFFVKNLH